MSCHQAWQQLPIGKNMEAKDGCDAEGCELEKISSILISWLTNQNKTDEQG